MTEISEAQPLDLIRVVGRIVSAYVANNPVSAADLPFIIRDVHAAVAGFAAVGSPSANENLFKKPTALQIRKSVTTKGIVSFLDGKTYQTLKRHLDVHGLDPHSYRERFGLPPDYPMVASGYAARRSEIAKSNGLGRPNVRTHADLAKVA